MRKDKMVHAIYKQKDLYFTMTIKRKITKWLIPGFAHHLQWQYFQQCEEQELALKEMGACKSHRMLDLGQENKSEIEILWDSMNSK